jgi:iron complex transport system substrate-binding protein
MDARPVRGEESSSSTSARPESRSGAALGMTAAPLLPLRWRLRGARLCAALLILLGLCPLPAHALRVVALAPHLAELVCAAGACDQLVGRVSYSDYPQAVTRLPSVGDAFSLNAEALLALDPELVIIWSNGTPAASIVQVDRLGIPALKLEFHTLADIESALRAIGDRLGTGAAARAAAARFHAQIDELSQRYRQARRLRVFYQIQAEPIFTVNRQSPISQAISICGGDNVFADLPRLAGSLGREAVLARDPDVVIWGRQDDARSIEAFWRRWPESRATRAGNLYAVDSDLLARSTPRMVQGIQELCAALDRARAKPPLPR